MRRFIDDRTDMTQTICISDGVRTVTEHLGTADEHAEVEDGVNTYLEDAGVP
jgi:hypothetical protein